MQDNKNNENNQILEEPENIQIFEDTEKKRKLWYGWREDASKQFNCSTWTIDYRYTNNAPDLIEWLDKEVQIRLERRNNAIETKKRIEKIEL